MRLSTNHPRAAEGTDDRRNAADANILDRSHVDRRVLVLEPGRTVALHGVRRRTLTRRRCPHENVRRRLRYTKSGITHLHRTITLPDDVRVRGSHSVTIDEPGKIRITFYPAAVDLCHERFEKLKDAIPFEAEKPPNAPATRRAPNQWYCRLDEGSWHNGRARLIDFVRDVEDAWRKHDDPVSDEPEGP